MPNQKQANPQQRRKRHALGNVAAALMMLFITAVIVLLADRWNHTIDISASQRHSLTQQSIDTVASVAQSMEIIAVLGADPAQRDAVDALVSRYQQHNDNLSLSFVNLETQPARARELQAAPGGELILRTVPATADGEFREERLQNLSERSLTSAFTRLSRATNRQVAFITGHGERSSTRQSNSDFSELAQRLQQSGLETREISLVTTPVIPAEVKLLVLAAPRQTYFPGEVASLLQYIGEGRNLLWMIDDITDNGLKALYSEFGIDPLPGVVLDASSAAYGAESPTFAVVDHQTLPTHPINHNLGNPLLMPGVTALNVTPLAAQSLQPMLLSSDQSWTESGPVVGEVRFDESDNEVRGPLLLATTITRAAMAPTSGSSDDPNPAAQLAAEQRIAIIGDADWLASQWIGNGANLEYAERLFNWLSADDSPLAFRVQRPNDALIDPSSRSVLLLGGGFLLGLPVLFFCIALSFWMRQRNG